MTVSSGIAESAKTGTAKSTTRKKGVWKIAPVLAAFFVILGIIYFSLGGTGINNSTLPDRAGWGVISDKPPADFNAAGVPNYWLDFSAPQGEERIKRVDKRVQACEAGHLENVWGGASSSGPVQRGGTITTLDGTPVAIPVDAIVCTAGPRGSALVLATGPAYAAYESFWRQRTAVGLACTPKAGWQCLMTLPVDPSNLSNATPYKVETPAHKGCISWETPADVMVLRDSVMYGVPQWVVWTGPEAARNMGFAHLPNHQPKAVYYKFGAC